MSSALMFSKPPARLLIIDEESHLQNFPRTAFAQENVQITFIHQANSILQKVEQECFDVIVCPLYFSSFSGWDLLRFLAKRKRDDLVILFSDQDKTFSLHWKEKAISQGAFDFLSKPITQEEFVWAVKRALSWKSFFYASRSPHEISSLHALFEAMAHASSLDMILNLMLDLIISECQADVASFAIYYANRNQWEEPFFKMSPQALVDRSLPQGKVGELNLSRLAEGFRKQPYLFVQDILAQFYFTIPPKNPQFLSLYSIPLYSDHQLLGALNVYVYQTPHSLGESSKRLLLALAFQATTIIKNFQFQQDLIQKDNRLIQIQNSMEDHLRATVVSFAHALEASDPYTRGHSERVSRYAHILGQGLGLTETAQEQVTQAALMHDIGKIGIRSDKLNKPGRLTDEEKAMFKTHPAKGKRILDPIPSMVELIPGTFCHHESFDGSGYPQALMGENIPLIGRIVAIADTYDAMTSDRSYRQALTHQNAVDELRKFAGSQFDPKLVPIFIRIIEEHRLEQEESNHEGVARFG